MAASYPSSAKSFTTKTAGDTIQPAHMNDAQDEITAVEGGLISGVAHDLKPSTDGVRSLGTTLLYFLNAFVRAVTLRTLAFIDNAGAGTKKLTLSLTNTLTADRTLGISSGDANRTITLTGNPTLADWFDQAVKAASDVAFNTVKERGRSFAMGASQDVAFDAGNYTASGTMTWTVGAGDVTAHSYRLVGDTLWLSVALAGTTVGGTPSTQLRVAVPAGFTIEEFAVGPAIVLDNGTFTTALVAADPTNAYVYVELLPAPANFTAATNATTVYFQLAVKVAPV